MSFTKKRCYTWASATISNPNPKITLRVISNLAVWVGTFFAELATPLAYVVSCVQAIQNDNAVAMATTPQVATSTWMAHHVLLRHVLNEMSVLLCLNQLSYLRKLNINNVNYYFNCKSAQKVVCPSTTTSIEFNKCK